MAEPRAPEGAQLLELSADYSDDELDAIAEVYDRARLRGRRDPADRDERVRRAVADAALRALVARRALVLEGGPARPRVRLLEPHAAVLDPFVFPDATVAIRTDRPGRTVVRSLFARGQAVTVQEALPGQAISRMTLHPRPRILDHLLAGIPPARSDTPEGRQRMELTPRMIEGTEGAIAAGTPAPACVPPAAADVLYARTLAVAVEVTSRDAQGVVSVERRSWIDAGALGVWELVDGDGEPPATVFLEPRPGAALNEWLADVASQLSEPAGA